MLNVNDFGAKGDGIVDDTLVIQTAINSGNELLIPSGIYLISSSQSVVNDLFKLQFFNIGHFLIIIYYFTIKI